MGSFNSCSSRSRGRRSKLKRTSFQTMNTHLATHHHHHHHHHHHQQGIKTVAVEQLCKFSTSSALCMNIVTWNMNGKVSYQDLAELVGVDRKCDLIVIGLQEVPRCNIGRLLQKTLVETHSLLGKAIMQSLQLFVFGPKNSDLFIKEVKVDKHAVGGFGGLIRRKKGAVAVSISFKGIRMVFISCHLSAHARNVEERNSQFRHISHSLFSKNQNPYARPSQITVWLGDLNYRIHGIDTLPARNLIQKNLHGLLKNNDQLLQEAERGQVFSGYSEGTLAFKPTYKYNIGSNNYDTSYKVRVPSWTDRILYKIEKFCNIEATLHSYESIDGIHSSDHKPVKAHLCLKVNKLSSTTPIKAVL
ncbi:type IV inositol polyphosphate 5-phosphatase 11 [Macadamia integrifolia]|uniref:type IV inositol polyphosphate 5-phosphatase 11 n=1 Tax=Macadamia integrifolia TaxID=60698 RepID=UPI001C500463|nr:type IV inositol polyphosphate 5-phosphatase 11 [Macadamia integrifolia]